MASPANHDPTRAVRRKRDSGIENWLFAGVHVEKRPNRGHMANAATNSERFSAHHLAGTLENDLLKFQSRVFGIEQPERAKLPVWVTLPSHF
jgi:hypothetical protein